VPTQTFFLGPQHLGRREVSPHPDWQERSLAYFCPTCGEVWGRVLVSTATTWDALYRQCSSCPPDPWAWVVRRKGCFSDPPGGYNQLQPDGDWPLTLLQYELLQTITNTEKEL
jgi:hypothetical protein